jgi:hypothetical protein
MPPRSTHLAANGAVAVAVSTDGGLRFTKVTAIIPTTPNGDAAPSAAFSGQPHYLSVVADRPSIAAGPGSVWVSYTSVPSAVIQASGARVTGLGRFGSFSAPQSVPSSAGRGGFAGTGGIAVGPRGQVLVTYQNLGGQCCSRIYTALDPDGLGPIRFGRPRLLADTNVEEGLRIPAQPDRGIGADPSLAWDRSGGLHNGRVYAVWTQRPKNTARTNIMFQYSDDNGTTWTKAVQLNADAVPIETPAGACQTLNAHARGNPLCPAPESFSGRRIIALALALALALASRASARAGRHQGRGRYPSCPSAGARARGSG